MKRIRRLIKAWKNEPTTVAVANVAAPADLAAEIERLLTHRVRQTGRPLQFETHPDRS